ncbi:MAG: RND family transporter [Syntrophobacteraceae bacterium]
MTFGSESIEDMPVVSDVKDFDTKSGIWLERLVFNRRVYMIVICSIITLLLGFQASKIKVTASFDNMIPQGHPYIKNYFENKGELAGLGNAVRIVVENTEGDILQPEFLDVLRQVSDEIVVTPGVDRAWVKSLWTPNVRWNTVNEQGFVGGPVMPPDYDGSPETLATLRTNIANAGLIGSLVGLDSKSSMIVVPLLEVDAFTGKRLDYSVFSHTLRDKIMTKETDKVKIHIIGFAKLIGDLIDALMRVMVFFAIAVLIAALILLVYTRCLRSTAVVIICSVVAVVWQLGLLATFGFALNPYSILVPFLIFAIGVSHGAQKMNGIMQDIGRGTHRVVAARYTFRRLFLAGVTALLADMVGFAVLLTIDIPVIKDLSMAASIGVAVLIFTNLLLLPCVLSFLGVSPKAALRSLQEEGDERGFVQKFTDLLVRFTETRWALGVVCFTLLIAVAGFIVSLKLQIGDLDPGAPELRAESRYNQDNAYITSHYGLSSDLFAVIVKTPKDGGMQWESVLEMDRLGWELQQLPAVQTTIAFSNCIKGMTSSTCEQSPKWFTVARNQRTLNFGATYCFQTNPELANLDVSVIPVVAYLKDHKAGTLNSVVNVVEKFAAEHNTADRKFLLAAGSSGIEAATNIVVEKANRRMMLLVYLAIIVLCFITFRNWRAVLVTVIPLYVTSILCEALMVFLGIGVKVATLPVIALGVGIGVDYALYLLSVQLTHQRMGMPLREAYAKAVQFTGKVVGLVGVTLAAGVITWSFSPIKFQADMGILLTFMFLWNMVGALIVIPALSRFLLQTKSVAYKGKAARIAKLAKSTINQ